MTKTRKRGVFYGYIIVAAGLLVSIFIIGTFNSFGVFFKPLSSEFGWARATTSAAMSVANLVMGVSGIILGILTDKYGPRVVLIIAGLSMGSGVLLMSKVTSLWQLYLFYGLLVGASMGAADIPIVATVARWFVKKRGMMIGLAKIGAGVGIMVMPLLSSWLISRYDWRTAYLVIGIIVLVGVISIALLFKRDPGQIGDQPDGAAKQEVVESNIITHHFSLREAVGTRQFWIFSAIWFCFMFTAQAVIVHIVPDAEDVGIPATVAATIISVIGGFSILGRFGLASLSDILGTKTAYFISFSLLAAGMFWVHFTREPWMFYLFAALYGTAHGGCFALLSPMVAGLFGLMSLGIILGVILFFGTVGGLISPMLAGWFFDIMGNYQVAFWICFGLALAALILISQLRPTGSKEVTND